MQERCSVACPTRVPSLEGGSPGLPGDCQGRTEPALDRDGRARGPAAGPLGPRGHAPPPSPGPSPAGLPTAPSPAGRPAPPRCSEDPAAPRRAHWACSARPLGSAPLRSALGGWAPGGSAARTSAGAGAGTAAERLRASTRRGSRAGHGEERTAAAGVARRRQVSRVSWAPAGGARAVGSPAPRGGRVAAVAAAQLWGAGAGGARGWGCALGGARVPAVGSRVARCCGIPEQRCGDIASQARVVALPWRGARCAPRAAEEPAGLGGKGTSSHGGAFADSGCPGHRTLVTGMGGVHCPGPRSPECWRRILVPQESGELCAQGAAASAGAPGVCRI